MIDRLALLQAAELPGVSVSELCRQTGISRNAFYKWRTQYAKEGAAGLEPRSRRPLLSPSQIPLRMELLICRLREELPCDNGAQHIHDELHRRAVSDVPSVRTVHRVLVRNGLVVAQPKKRPRSSYIRFEYDRPNACWQIDATQWKLRNGRIVWVIDLLDDHSRKVVAALAVGSDNAANAWAAFCRAAADNGVPAMVLSDNGTSFAGAATRLGPGEFEANLATLGVRKANSRPYHPQTCGKVERFHQTLKRWLDRHDPAVTLADLQTQLDTFTGYYNHTRPHRAIARRTPAAAYTARPKAVPTPPTPTQLPPHHRVRVDRVDTTGVVTLRHHSRLHHIGIGRAHAGKRVTLLAVDLHIRIITDDGELLRELTLDPTRDYQPQRR
jgi:transposase InsO family protein